ncbi:MAG: MotA/TolQ/ExbB proton channel family protein, partial [Gammaproteobacteria bacterium]|nr:MotA/TolQ/ExbB proton channel family protein [Gammaproteobacteria bacterium]
MRAFPAMLCGLLCLCSAAAWAQEQGAVQDGLIELYEKVARQAALESERSSEREQRFQASADDRARMLKQVQDDIARLERHKADLKGQFDGNEDRLAELATQLDRRIGDLGELFGVFRQTADDVQTLLFDSPITLEHPERRAEAAALAESAEVPTIPQMRALWRLLMQEIAHSGQVSRFPAEIIEPAGGAYQAQAVRVGLFNVVADGKYLNYLPESNQLVELPRQPAGTARRSAEALGAAELEQVVDFALDPSRGALLGLLVQSPSLIERIQQGRLVGYFILAITAIGLILVAERGLRLAAVNRRIKRQLEDLGQVKDDNPVGRILSTYHEHAHLDDLELISRHLESVVIADVAEVRKGLPAIRVLAA